ncbi:hypothetical protein C2845_PM11G00030 [Panicum miliaceum]|uniref:DUF1618 domain-containing protein n=1 Tax=Panicum miliaceum TaxID=4540 RepID=A0A3L6RQX1_PANMI|nr:hypothetical protein C2845_PM11G00030 [Panicum miliaceum]
MAAANAPAGSGGVLPNWVMLERFIFRRDDPQSFREDKRTSATGVTSVGAHFRVSFILAEPPTPSRLYLSWPGGPKEEMMCHLAAAHRNLVLLRLDSFVDPSNPSPFGEIAHDYFIYYVAADHRSQSQAQSTPALRRLPGCTVHNEHFGRPIPRPFVPWCVGLLCCGEEFAVAYLGVGWRDPETERLEVELWVLRSTIIRDSTDGDEKWEVKYLPIQGQDVEHYNLIDWTTSEVIPFKNALCWVDCNRGVLYCEDVCGDNPKATFAGGRTLAFLDVGRHDGADLGRMVPETGFTIVFMAVTETQSANSLVVQADDLWATHTPEDLPRIFGKLSLVTIDLSTKRVIGSVVPYTNGEEDLSTDDADLVKAKPSFFMNFLPAEFPKFLNLQRLVECTCLRHVFESLKE